MGLGTEKLEEGVFATGGHGLKRGPPLAVATQRAGKRGNRSPGPGENGAVVAAFEGSSDLRIGKNQSLPAMGVLRFLELGGWGEHHENSSQALRSAPRISACAGPATRAPVAGTQGERDRRRNASPQMRDRERRGRDEEGSGEPGSLHGARGGCRTVVPRPRRRG